MNFDKLDNSLISLADRGTGRLEAMGVGLPVVLREILTLEMIVGAALPFTAMAQGSTISAALWTICMAVILPRRLATWKQYNRDAKAEWSEELSRRYFSRAERNRHYSAPRVVAWMLLLMVLSLLFWSAGTGLYEATDTLLLALCSVELFRGYAECAHPQPPSKTLRKRFYSPAGAT